MHPGHLQSKIPALEATHHMRSECAVCQFAVCGLEIRLHRQLRLKAALDSTTDICDRYIYLHGDIVYTRCKFRCGAYIIHVHVELRTAVEQDPWHHQEVPVALAPAHSHSHQRQVALTVLSRGRYRLRCDVAHWASVQLARGTKGRSAHGHTIPARNPRRMCGRKRE